MNVAESNALELLLKGRGLTATEKPEEADAVIINTCSVRKSAENRIWGRLGFYSAEKKRHPLKLIVTGCMAERMHDELKKAVPAVDLVIGTDDKALIPEFILGKKNERENGYKFLTSYYKDGDFSAYVPIMNGCNNFCSYCIVPYVRGREVSRKVEDILSEIDFLETKGVKEVTLLGQNVNSYKATYNGVEIDFPSLLELIIPHMNCIEYLRFESPHPKDFSLHLMKVINSNKKISKHIHLPMQSGSTKVLKEMNRKTTREGFISLIEKIKEEIPSVSFSTDVMVGFPGESEEEYEETLSMMEILNPTEAFMYYFNPREGTRAEKMENQIDMETKTRRLETLINEQLKRQTRQKEEKTKKAFITSGLLLGPSRDDKNRFLVRTEHNEYISVLLNRKYNPGEIVDINVTSFKGNTYLGEEL